MKKKAFTPEQIIGKRRETEVLLVAAGIGFLVGSFLMFKPYRKARRLLAKERQERKLTGPTREPPPVEAAPVEKAAEKPTIEASAG